MNTTFIGEVVSFDPVDQTAVIQLHMTDVTSTEESNYNNKTLAKLIEVPVHFPRFGGFRITSPIAKGDNCIVLFAQCGISHWLYEARKEYNFDEGRPESAAARKYSKSDAIAIVGLSNLTDPIKVFEPTFLELRNDDNTQRVTMKPDGEIEINTNGNIFQMLKDGTTNITAPTAINISTPLATFDTDVKIEGNLVVDGTSTAEDHLSDNGAISGKSHKHGGVISGGAITLVPQ